VRFTQDVTKCKIWPLFKNDVSDINNIKSFAQLLNEQIDLIDKDDVMLVILTSYFYDVSHQLAQFPEFKFSIVGTCELADCTDVEELPNVQRILFSDDEMGFLAGAVAARISSTAEIAIISDSSTPDERLFTNGFLRGALFGNYKSRVFRAYTVEGILDGGKQAPYFILSSNFGTLERLQVYF
jgi:basic membrane lipoprotein Med (substrate-binding protein (PBP1-ABC) superfamily)